MTRPLCLVRPEPGWAASAAAARAKGLEVVGEPLFRARPLDWQAPDESFDALLVGSARVFDCAGAGLEAFAHLPVHAVGEATAQAARAAGFALAGTGSRGLQAVLDGLPQAPARLLRLGGEERVPLTPPPGITLVERAVYRIEPLPLPDRLAQVLTTRNPVVALHSAASARHFSAECARLQLDRQLLLILALAPRIARAAGSGWRAIHSVDSPTDGALLVKALNLCNSLG